MNREMKTPKVNETKLKTNASKFVVGPYERGFGTTIGNALRRVLLSSISRFAPVAIALQVTKIVQIGKSKKEIEEEIKIAKHELDVLEGIREDVYQIILNVKSLILKVDSSLFNDSEVISLKGENIKGSLKAKDLVLPAGVQIINGDLVLMNVAPNEQVKSASLIIFAEIGRGYWTSIENRALQTAVKKFDVSTISIDANFSPIKRVSFEINNLAGYARAHEELIMEIETDGSLTPKEAFKESGNILVKQLSLISQESSKTFSFIEEEERANVKRTQPFQLEELGFDNKLLNILKKAGVRDLNDLASKSDKELMDIKDLGAKSIAKIRNAIEHKK